MKDINRLFLAFLASTVLLSSRPMALAADAAASEGTVTELPPAIGTAFHPDIRSDILVYDGDATADDSILASSESSPAEGYLPVVQNDEASYPENDVFAAEAASNSCGETAAWVLENGVLTISGVGKMNDFTSSAPAPWRAQSSDIQSIIVEDGITYIGKFAFLQLTAVTSVSISPSVTQLGEAAFGGCSALTQVQLPSSVADIGKAAFYNCTALKDLTAPGAKSIGAYAFQSSGLTSFFFGKEVEYVDPYSFYGCSQLAAFSIDPANPNYSVSDGVLFNRDGTTLLCYPACKSGASYTLSEGVQEIGEYAFGANRLLRNINFGETVKRLGVSAFQDCMNLSEIILPDSITEAGNFTFYNSRIVSVKFGSGLQATSYEMFERCSRLASIDFGTGLTALGARTFAYCYSLEEVDVPPQITTIGNSCFGECYRMRTIRLGGVSSIAFQTFLNDTALSEVILPEGLKNIYRISFEGCTSLKSIVIPSTVTYISQRAFPDTTELIFTSNNLEVFGVDGYRELADVHITGVRNYAYAFDVLARTNAERAALGQPPLVMNASLLETAMQRAGEIAVLFSHTRPDSSLCLDINPLMYAENIAAGDTTPSGTVDSWMASSGHKANILASNHKTIGIGCFEIDGIFFWVQCFGIGDDTDDCPQPANQEITQQIRIATDEFSAAAARNNTGVVFSDNSTYLFQFLPQLPSSVETGDTAKVALSLRNPGFTSAVIAVDPSDFVWSTDDRNVLTIAGEYWKAISAGSTVVHVSTKNGKLPAEATIAVTAGTPIPAGSCEVILPNDLRRIEDGAFQHTEIASVSVLPGVEEVGALAFADCASLTYIYLPDSLSSIADDAFLNSDRVIFICSPGSYSQSFAHSHGIPVILQ